MTKYFDRICELLSEYFNGTITESEIMAENIELSDVYDLSQHEKIIWGSIHQINESDPNYRTTDEELNYIYSCLTNKNVIDEDILEKKQIEGLKKRFKKSIN